MAVSGQVCLRWIGTKFRWESGESAELASNWVRPGIDSVSSGEDEMEVSVDSGVMRVIVGGVMWEDSTGQSLVSEVAKELSEKDCV